MLIWVHIQHSLDWRSHKTEIEHLLWVHLCTSFLHNLSWSVLSWSVMITVGMICKVACAISRAYVSEMPDVSSLMAVLPIIRLALSGLQEPDGWTFLLLQLWQIQKKVTHTSAQYLWGLLPKERSCYFTSSIGSKPLLSIQMWIPNSLCKQGQKHTGSSAATEWARISANDGHCQGCLIFGYLDNSTPFIA